MATLCPSTFAATVGVSRPRRQKANDVKYISGINSYGGLKAHDQVTGLGMPISTEQKFAKVISSLRTPSKGKGRGGGGALSSKCSNAEEIFRIAAIMNGLVLVGVAVGFVLLRIEASIEEAE